MQNTKSEFGVELSKAPGRYCRPIILERHLKSREAALWGISLVDGILGRQTLDEKDRRAADDAFNAVVSEMIRDVGAKVIDGRLVAIGFVAGPTGHDPDAPKRRIPDDVLQAQDCQIEWGNGKITGNGLTFVGVRVGPTYEAPGAAATLVGCSLSECFRKVVLDDWVRREIEESVLSSFPGRIFQSEQYHYFASGRWPVRFEDWSYPDRSVSPFGYPIPVTGDRLPWPPDKAIAVRTRAKEEFRRLITWLRDGTLIAEGTKEPSDHELTRDKIKLEWWARAGVELDGYKGTLYSGSSGDGTLIFSEIKMVSPEAAAQKSANTRINDESIRSKGKPGRKPTWDWTGALREMMQLANSPDGLPTPQSAIERHISDWFLDNYGKTPTESAVREFVSDHLPSNYRSNAA